MIIESAISSTTGEAGSTDEIEHNIVLSSESDSLEQQTTDNNEDSDIEVVQTLNPPVQRRRPRRR